MTDSSNHLDLALHFAEQILKQQDQSWEIIDQKNTILMAAYGIIIAVGFEIGLSFASTQTKAFYWLLLAVFLIFSALGIICSIASLRPKPKGQFPNPNGILKSLYEDEELMETKADLYNYLTNSIDLNDKSLQTKRDVLFLSIKWFFPMSLVFLFILFIICFYSI